MGTQLQAAGLPAGQPAELWNEGRPETVTAVHRGYLKAGAEVLLTNTIGANRFRLGDAADRLATAGARLARRAADGAGRAVAVAGAMGPADPRMTVPFRWEAYSAQAAALVAGGVDWLWLETFNALAEARLALTAVLAAGRPVVLTLHFGPAGLTAAGEDAAAIAAGIADLPLLALGANCGEGPGPMAPVVRAMRRAIPDHRPVVAKPNAGLPDAAGAYPIEPDEFAAGLAALRAAGAAWLGGCCGTTAAHLSAATGRLQKNM